MNSTTKKVILRYKKEDLDACEKAGRFYIDTSHDPAKYCCTVAYIEGSNVELEKQGFKKGDKLLVQYLVSWDESEKDNPYKKERNQYFIEAQNGDELRWCSWDQVFGKFNEDGTFTPTLGWVYCELPKIIPEHEENGIVVLEQKVNTDTKGFETKIVFIHPQDAEEYGLNAGDEILADKNTDAVKRIADQLYIRVPAQFILAVL